MEVTFWGVRGSIPSPGPATVRYGGNTSCVSVRLADGEIIMIDCGTGARKLRHLASRRVFGKGKGSATVLLSHAHWDHIQGFPFFGPFYVPGNHFTVVGGSHNAELLERVLERQMAAQFFPVQSYRNMGAQIDMRAVPEDREVRVGTARITAHPNPHGPTQVMAFSYRGGRQGPGLRQRRRLPRKRSHRGHDLPSTAGRSADSRLHLHARRSRPKALTWTVLAG